MRLFALLLVSMLASVSQAQTRLSATVGPGQTRVVPAGNYFVDFRLTVSPGGKIVFEPGVNIEVRTTTYWLLCGGEAQLNGTAAQPITITTQAGLASPGMLGMVPSTGSTARPRLSMAYTNFSSHANNLVFCQRTDFQVSNCSFINTSTSATKAVIRASQATFGTVQDSVLDLVSKTGYGFNVGQSATATDSTGIDLVNVAVLNSMQPVNIQKIAPIAVLNGSID
ncbi:MAG: hypothetical protein RLZZ396_3010 [Planctomycetota bacterium]|jgi:hypothetical protein